MVEGWLDEVGDMSERCQDVAWSDDRVPLAIGNTVNVSEASYSNAIGAPDIATF